MRTYYYDTLKRTLMDQSVCANLKKGASDFTHTVQEIVVFAIIIVSLFNALLNALLRKKGITL